MKKIAVKFNLLDKSKGRTSVTMSVTWEGLRLQTSIGVSVPSSQFDIQKGKIKSNVAHAMENNNYMEIISQQIKNYYFSSKANNQHITKGDMKIFIDKILGKDLQHIEKELVAEEAKEYSFFELFDQFISSRQNNPKYGKRSIQSYFTTKRHLLDFSIATGAVIDLMNISTEFADSLVLYLANEKKLVNSTIDRNFRTLKTFLNWAYDNDFLSDLKWKRVIANVTRDFKLKTDSNRIVLSNDEIALFENFKTESAKLQRINDLFLIHIYTGLRVSDLMSLKPEYISLEDDTIVLYQEKTDTKVIIPLHSKLKKILIKYPELRLPSYSDQKYNEYLKILGKEVGLNSRIVITKFYGKTKVEETYEKWQLLTSHVARNTCITYLIKKGLIPEYVMQISGHKSRSAFQTYVKIAKSEAQLAVKRAWEE